MMVNKKRAFALLTFISLCRSNDYCKGSNLLYLLLGEKLGAASSSDVINNPGYKEEIDFLIKEGLLELEEERG